MSLTAAIRGAVGTKWAGHMIGLRRPEGLPADLSRRLQERGVFVSVRGSSIRVAPHLYNDESDIDALFGALDES